MNSTTPHTLPFSQLGHYEILSTLGRGGMGLVYLARDTRLEREVAIKCLRSELFEAHYIERFKREALLLAKLNHPNIVQIYDFVETPEQLALVMEFVQGQNLQQHLREHLVNFPQRMRWLTQIAQGLAVAHDAGIIHRDLKAENILIDKRGQAKISDLGIAKSQDFNATLTDHVTGSYCSMSPEQAMGEALDFKSDLFSFGILAYQLLCGAHPFGETENKLQLMQRIISHPPIAPAKHNPNLPPKINDLLGQLLSKDPEKRPGNTHWVAAQLEALSHLQLANDFVSDETQALIPNGSAANQTNVKYTGINRAVKTQDHPTFETRFVAISTAPKKSRWLPITNYLLENKISVSFGLFSVLLLAAVAVWQLQPKPPKYIAVIPPKLTAEGMQESQQELIKGAVYDAIQQGVIQLDGYYLIPREEIADANGDTEAIRKATAADELITAEILCKTDTCAINLTKLRASTDLRLRIANTTTIDVLTDDYAAIAEALKSSMGTMYDTQLPNTSDWDSPINYTTFLEIGIQYKKLGATQAQLDELDNLHPTALRSLSLQSLYTEIALDLYYEQGDAVILTRLERRLTPISSNNQNPESLYNHFFLMVAQQDFIRAKAILTTLKPPHIRLSAYHELQGYSALAARNFTQAIQHYQNAIASKATAKNYYYLALTYWNAGDTKQAQMYLDKSLLLSPNFFKAHALYGAIAIYQGDMQKAKNAASYALAQRPDDPFNINNLGLSYLLTRSYPLANKNFATACQLAPFNTSLCLNLADTENLLGKDEDAIKRYEAIIHQLDKKDPSAEELSNLAQAYAHTGKISDALGILKKLEQQDTQNAQTTYTAALVHTIALNQASAIFNIEASLNNGLNKIWFELPWFDRLCQDAEFTELLKKHGAPERCTHH